MAKSCQERLLGRYGRCTVGRTLTCSSLVWCRLLCGKKDPSSSGWILPLSPSGMNTWHSTKAAGRKRSCGRPIPPPLPTQTGEGASVFGHPPCTGCSLPPWRFPCPAARPHVLRFLPRHVIHHATPDPLPLACPLIFCGSFAPRTGFDPCTAQAALPGPFALRRLLGPC